MVIRISESIELEPLLLACRQCIDIGAPEIALDVLDVLSTRAKAQDPSIEFLIGQAEVGIKREQAGLARQIHAFHAVSGDRLYRIRLATNLWNFGYSVLAQQIAAPLADDHEEWVRNAVATIVNGTPIGPREPSIPRPMRRLPKSLGQFWPNLFRMTQRLLPFDANCALAALGQEAPEPPEYRAQFHLLRSECLQAQGNNDGAANELERALALEPDNKYFRICYAVALLNSQRPTESSEQYEWLVNQPHHEFSQLASQTLAFVAFTGSRYTPEQITGFVRHWGRTYLAPGLSPRSSNPLPPASGRVIRVGYLHSIFHLPAYHNILIDMFAAHTKHRFELFGYSSGGNVAALPAELKAPMAAFRDISTLNDEEAAALIRSDKIDVLIDLDGFSIGTRTGVLSRRPAPILATWFNGSRTFGCGLVDFLIADRIVLPDSERGLFDEEVLHLPHAYFAMRHRGPTPDVAPAPSLSRGAITFGSFNRPDKLNAGVFDSWARILKRVPGSRLVIRQGGVNQAVIHQTVQQFQRREIDADRILVSTGGEYQDFLGAYSEIDIGLDPFPFNGGVTTFEMLWQGVPLVTFNGDRWPSRVGATILTAIGVPELIAPNVSAYEDLAVTLASDTERLKHYRGSLRQRLASSPFNDIEGFTRDFEKIIETMIENASAW